MRLLEVCQKGGGGFATLAGKRIGLPRSREQRPVRFHKNDTSKSLFKCSAISVAIMIDLFLKKTGSKT